MSDPVKPVPKHRQWILSSSSTVKIPSPSSTKKDTSPSHSVVPVVLHTTNERSATLSKPVTVSHTNNNTDAVTDGVLLTNAVASFVKDTTTYTSVPSSSQEQRMLSTEVSPLEQIYETIVTNNTNNTTDNTDFENISSGRPSDTPNCESMSIMNKDELMPLVKKNSSTRNTTTDEEIRPSTSISSTSISNSSTVPSSSSRNKWNMRKVTRVTSTVTKFGSTVGTLETGTLVPDISSTLVPTPTKDNLDTTPSSVVHPSYYSIGLPSNNNINGSSTSTLPPLSSTSSSVPSGFHSVNTLIKVRTVELMIHSNDFSTEELIIYNPDTNTINQWLTDDYLCLIPSALLYATNILGSSSLLPKGTPIAPPGTIMDTGLLLSTSSSSSSTEDNLPTGNTVPPTTVTSIFPSIQSLVQSIDYRRQCLLLRIPLILSKRDTYGKNNANVGTPTNTSSTSTTNPNNEVPVSSASLPSSNRSSVSSKVQVSIRSDIASSMGWNRQTVLVYHFRDRKEVEKLFGLAHVEFSFREQFASRSGMWRFRNALEGSTLYFSQSLNAAGYRMNVRDLGGITVSSHPVGTGTDNDSSTETTAAATAASLLSPVLSGIVTENTRFTFRSRSSRMVLLIQMSREMWTFDNDGLIRFEKLVNHFLRTLFHRWMTYGTSHAVTIILFTRTRYNYALSNYLQYLQTILTSSNTAKEGSGGPANISQVFNERALFIGTDGYLYEDFYIPLIEDMVIGSTVTSLPYMNTYSNTNNNNHSTSTSPEAGTETGGGTSNVPSVGYTAVSTTTGKMETVSQINEWNHILRRLKYAFNTFPIRANWGYYGGWDDTPRSHTTPKGESKDGNAPPKTNYLVGQGVPVTAENGNFLEAINLALNIFERHHIDRDLCRMGQNIIVLTAGNGSYEVDPALAQMTKQRMMDDGCGCDVVSMAKPPLHNVPLFITRTKVPQQTISTVTTSPFSTTPSHVISFSIPHWIHCSFFGHVFSDRDGFANDNGTRYLMNNGQKMNTDALSRLPQTFNPIPLSMIFSLYDPRLSRLGPSYPPALLEVLRFHKLTKTKELSKQRSNKSLVVNPIEEDKALFSSRLIRPRSLVTVSSTGLATVGLSSVSLPASDTVLFHSSSQDTLYNLSPDDTVDLPITSSVHKGPLESLSGTVVTDLLHRNRENNDSINNGGYGRVMSDLSLADKAAIASSFVHGAQFTNNMSKMGSSTSEISLVSVVTLANSITSATKPKPDIIIEPFRRISKTLPTRENNTAKRPFSFIHPTGFSGYDDLGYVTMENGLLYNQNYLLDETVPLPENIFPWNHLVRRLAYHVDNLNSLYHDDPLKIPSLTESKTGSSVSSPLGGTTGKNTSNSLSNDDNGDINYIQSLYEQYKIHDALVFSSTTPTANPLGLTNNQRIPLLNLQVKKKPLVQRGNRSEEKKGLRNPSKLSSPRMSTTNKMATTEKNASVNSLPAPSLHRIPSNELFPNVPSLPKEEVTQMMNNSSCLFLPIVPKLSGISQKIFRNNDGEVIAYLLPGSGGNNQEIEKTMISTIDASMVSPPLRGETMGKPFSGSTESTNRSISPLSSLGRNYTVNGKNESFVSPTIDVSQGIQSKLSMIGRRQPSASAGLSALSSTSKWSNNNRALRPDTFLPPSSSLARNTSNDKIASNENLVASITHRNTTLVPKDTVGDDPIPSNVIHVSPPSSPFDIVALAAWSPLYRYGISGTDYPLPVHWLSSHAVNPTLSTASILQNIMVDPLVCSILLSFSPEALFTLLSFASTEDERTKDKSSMLLHRSSHRSSPGLRNTRSMERVSSLSLLSAVKLLHTKGTSSERSPRAKSNEPTDLLRIVSDDGSPNTMDNNNVIRPLVRDMSDLSLASLIVPRPKDDNNIDDSGKIDGSDNGELSPTGDVLFIGAEDDIKNTTFNTSITSPQQHQRIANLRLESSNKDTSSSSSILAHLNNASSSLSGNKPLVSPLANRGRHKTVHMPLGNLSPSATLQARARANIAQASGINSPTLPKRIPSYDSSPDMVALPVPVPLSVIKSSPSIDNTAGIFDIGHSENMEPHEISSLGSLSSRKEITKESDNSKGNSTRSNELRRNSSKIEEETNSNNNVPLRKKLLKDIMFGIFPPGAGAGVTNQGTYLLPPAAGALINPFRRRPNEIQTMTANRRRWWHMFPAEQIADQQFTTPSTLSTVERTKTEEENLVNILQSFVPNWKSLIQPAIMPLTTDFLPTEQELQTQYAETVYSVVLPLRVPNSLNVTLNSNLESPVLVDDTAVTETKLVTNITDKEPKTKSLRSFHETILEEMICQRLAQDFQLVIPSNESMVPTGSTAPTTGILNFARKDENKNIFILSMGHRIHKIIWNLNESNVEVKMYFRRPGVLTANKGNTSLYSSLSMDYNNSSSGTFSNNASTMSIGRRNDDNNTLPVLSTPWLAGLSVSTSSTTTNGIINRSGSGVKKLKGSTPQLRSVVSSRIEEENIRSINQNNTSMFGFFDVPESSHSIGRNTQSPLFHTQTSPDMVNANPSALNDNEKDIQRNMAIHEAEIAILLANLARILAPGYVDTMGTFRYRYMLWCPYRRKPQATGRSFRMPTSAATNVLTNTALPTAHTGTTSSYLNVPSTPTMVGLPAPLSLPATAIPSPVLYTKDASSNVSHHAVRLLSSTSVSKIPLLTDSNNGNFRMSSTGYTASPQLSALYPSLRGGDANPGSRTLQPNVAEEEFNWSQLDTLLASDHDNESITLSESIRYKRAWFLLMPIPTGPINTGTSAVKTESSGGGGGNTREQFAFDRIHNFERFWSHVQARLPDLGWNQTTNTSGASVNIFSPSDRTMNNTSAALGSTVSPSLPCCSNDDSTSIQSIRVDLRNRGSAPFEWAIVQYGKVYNPYRAFPISIQWVAATSAAIDSLVNGLIRRARQHGFVLLTVPEYTRKAPPSPRSANISSTTSNSSSTNELAQSNHSRGHSNTNLVNLSSGVMKNKEGEGGITKIELSSSSSSLSSLLTLLKSVPLDNNRFDALPSFLLPIPLPLYLDIGYVNTYALVKDMTSSGSEGSNNKNFLGTDNPPLSTDIPSYPHLLYPWSTNPSTVKAFEILYDFEHTLVTNYGFIQDRTSHGTGWSIQQKGWLGKLTGQNNYHLLHSSGRGMGWYRQYVHYSGLVFIRIHEYGASWLPNRLSATRHQLPLFFSLYNYVETVKRESKTDTTLDNDDYIDDDVTIGKRQLFRTVCALCEELNNRLSQRIEV